MTTRPSGTVTFLFTDIEGSTRLAQQHPAAWPGIQARHHAILQSAIESHGGYVFQIIGDAFCAAFHTAPDALAAAIDVQRALVGATTDTQRTNGQMPVAPIRVRMGLHTGSATARPDGDYEGYMALVRVQRIMSGAYGGQVLMSQDVADLVGRDLPAGVGLRDLGTHRLKDLGAPEHLHQLTASDLPADFPPLKTADHPNNLPTQLTSFIGRDAEVVEVRRLLGGTRLLTLMGAGGVGKTRLALQVAAEEQAAFPDGVWFVELAPLADPALIPTTIASAVGVREEPNRPMLSTLGDHFHAKTALIVLDNCEHLIADAAQVCDTLLHTASHLKIIATSRETLGIAGEHAYRVPSLEIPNPKAQIPTAELSRCASVQLFTTRAQAARSDFALTAANADAVAQICRRLDGIPLAIELAAARVRSMTAEQIVARLDDRFRLLTGGSRTAMARQQTLRALIDWSYRLLSDHEKILLRRLSVFAGGWSLEAAEAVCADGDATGAASFEARDVLDMLAHLVDRSLVVLDENAGRPRYRMLETIRQYAREELDKAEEAVQMRDRHLAYYIECTTAAHGASSDSELAASMDFIAQEADNLRSALTWAREVDSTAGLHLLDKIVVGLHVFGRGKEACEWLASFLARSVSEVSIVRARALRIAGYFAASILMDYAAARRYGEESIAMYRQLGDAQGLARALAQSSLALGRLAPAQGEANLRAGLQIAQDTSDLALEAETLLYFGEYWRLLGLGNDEEAERCHKRSVDLYRRAQLRLMTGVGLCNLAFVVLHRRDHQTARRLLHEALTIASDEQSPPFVALSLAGLAGVAAMQSKNHAAARLAGTATAVFERMRNPLENNDRVDFERYVTLARAQSESAAFESAFAAGYAMPTDEAVAYALEVSRD